MKLGFIGLGHLGKAIAGRLLEQGHELTVWNRTPEKAAGMVVEVANDPADLVRGSEVVFLCLFDSQAVREVLTAENGLLSTDVASLTIVDLSTNHFRDVAEFHELCAQAGATYLEAPVLGSVVPASQGALTVLVSGDTAAYQQVRPLLDDIGQHIFHLETPTTATKMKLINNLALGSFMATIAEALSLGEDVGIDRAEVLDILGVGGGNSMVLNAKRAKLLAEDFSPHFTGALIYKDLHCLQDLAYEQKKTLFTGAVVKELYAKTYAEGLDRADFSAIYKLFK